MAFVSFAAFVFAARHHDKPQGSLDGCPVVRPAVLLAVLLAISPPLAGCAERQSGPSFAGAPSDEMTRTADGWLVLGTWWDRSFEGPGNMEVAFDVPRGMGRLDLDIVYRMAGGQAYPRLTSTYTLPAGEARPATSNGGTGLNGAVISDPPPGRWTLAVDGSENEATFTADFHMYACASGADCRESGRPAADAGGHGRR